MFVPYCIPHLTVDKGIEAGEANAADRESFLGGR
jgi:hypothetical protein